MTQPRSSLLAPYSQLSSHTCTAAQHSQPPIAMSEPSNANFLITSADTIPGCDCVALGPVYGSSMRELQSVATYKRSDHTGPHLDKLDVYRERAIARMARKRGADAIVAFRFDTASAQYAAEICAYGTAVKYRT